MDRTIHIFFWKICKPKKIIQRLENENLWVESRIDGDAQHMFIGGKNQNDGKKIHLIFGETGEIRIDKSDKKPSDMLKSVISVLKKDNGDTVKSTIEFFNEKL